VIVLGLTAGCANVDFLMQQPHDLGRAKDAQGKGSQAAGDGYFSIPLNSEITAGASKLLGSPCSPAEE